MESPAFISKKHRPAASSAFIPSNQRASLDGGARGETAEPGRGMQNSGRLSCLYSLGVGSWELEGRQNNSLLHSWAFVRSYLQISHRALRMSNNSYHGDRHQDWTRRHPHQQSTDKAIHANATVSGLFGRRERKNKQSIGFLGNWTGATPAMGSGWGREALDCCDSAATGVLYCTASERG